MAKKTRAQRNIDWCEKYLVLPEGAQVGQPLHMAEFMKDDFRLIYDNKAEGGTRRAIISRGRKNAKSTETAMILLLHLVGPEAQRNGQLYSAAQSRDQAALVFNLAAKMVRMDKRLHAAVQIRDNAKELLCPTLGTHYRALSAEATTAFGLNPALVIHDELGQVKGPRSPLYEALETAVGAQAHPLTIIISTQARTDADLLSVLIDDALAGNDPRTVLRLDTAPIEDDPFSERTIRKANPALNVFMNKREVMAMARDAERMPAREAEFRNLVLNQRVDADARFVTQADWKACGGETRPIDNVPVYAGLDLSSVSDLTALVLIGRVANKWQVHPTFWLPDEGLELKATQDRVPYDYWRQAGFLKTTPGKTVSYDYVAHYLRGVFDHYKIEKLAFDRWNMKHLRPWLLEAGFTEAELEAKFVEFGQGTQSMSPALRDLEQVVLERDMCHGDHPVLTMCAANSVVEGKDDANRKLSKNKSTGRIDGMQALAMAFGVAPLKAKAPNINTMIF